MTYIEPQSEVTLYKGIPLDPSYKNTTRYANKDEQEADFLTRERVYFDRKFSYIRTTGDAIRVEVPYKTVYNCNYMTFKNDAYENRTWYAFILGASYISDNVTELYFQIDVMQSYMFDYEFKKSYIERQHESTLSEWYTNTQPENIETGSTYTQTTLTGFRGWSWMYTIVATSGPNGEKITGLSKLNNVPTGCQVISYEEKNFSKFVEMVENYINNGYGDNIVNIYMGPAFSGSNSVTLKCSNALGSYKPKNGKAYQYPYRIVEVYNNLGACEEFRPEYYGDKDATSFTIKGDIKGENYPSPVCAFLPTNYGQADTEGWEYLLTYSVFPTIAHAGDSYATWWAQNKNTYLASLNAIRANYDTATAVASINTTIANASAATSLANTKATAANALTQAQNSYNTATSNAAAQYRTATSGVGAQITGGISSAIQNFANPVKEAAGKVTNLVAGSDDVVLSGVASWLQGNAATVSQTVNNVGTALNTTLNGTNVTAQTTLDAANASALTALQNAQSGAATSIQVAQNSYRAALKNNALSEKAATLSALTTANNATAALVAKKQDMQHQPNTLIGQSGCDGFNVASDTQRAGFSFEVKTIAPEYLKRVDDYFEAYGYAQNSLAVPTILNRPYWSYLKTVGANVFGKLPAQVLQSIAGIYDNGVTTWKNLESVGNYDLDNHGDSKA